MIAIVSGRAQAAAFFHEGGYVSVHWSAPETLVSRQPEELRWVLGDPRDCHLVQVSQVGDIRFALEEAVLGSLALDVATLLLDQELSTATRSKAARKLDQLIGDLKTRDYLEGIVYAAPVPDDGDVVGALGICESGGFNQSLDFIMQLDRHQAEIADVAAAWNVAITGWTLAEEERWQLHSRLIAKKWFHTCTLALAQGKDLQAVGEPLTKSHEIPDEFYRSWVQEIYRLQAVRFCSELPARPHYISPEDLQREWVIVQRLQQRLPGATDGEFTEWQSLWSSVCSRRLIESLQDSLILSFPKAEHVSRCDEVLREVLRYFYTSGIYQCNESLPASGGVFGFLNNVAQRTMGKVIKAQLEDQPVDIRAFMAEESDWGTPSLRWTEFLRMWSHLARQLCSVLGGVQIDRTLIAARSLLAKPKAALDSIWREVQGKVRRQQQLTSIPDEVADS